MNYCCYFEILLFVGLALGKKIAVNPDTTIECHRREFSFRVVNVDPIGRKCWDTVTAMSCWGRCDSGEIGDWRFPFKRPFHPVCVHDRKQVRYAILQNCDPGVDLSLAVYEYQEALTCSCMLCDSSTTSCQGIPSTYEGRNPSYRTHFDPTPPTNVRYDQNLESTMTQDQRDRIFSKPGRIFPVDPREVSY